MTTTIKAFSLNIDGNAATVYLLSTPHPQDPSKKLVLPMTYIPQPAKNQTKHIRFLLDVNRTMGRHDNAGRLEDTQTGQKELPPSRLFLALQTIKTMMTENNDNTVFSLTPFDGRIHPWGFTAKKAADINVDELFNDKTYGKGKAIYDALASLTPSDGIKNGHTTTILVTDGCDYSTNKSLQDAVTQLKNTFAHKLPSLVVVGIDDKCDKASLHAIAKLSNTEEIYVDTAQRDAPVLNRISSQIAYGQHVVFNLPNNVTLTSQIVPYEQVVPSEAYCVDANLPDPVIVGSILGATAIKEIDATPISHFEELANDQAQAIIYGAWLRDEASRIYEAPYKSFKLYKGLQERLAQLKLLDITLQNVTVAVFGKDSLHAHQAVLQDKLLNVFKKVIYAVIEQSSDPDLQSILDGQNLIIREEDKNEIITDIKEESATLLSKDSILGITEEQLNNITETIIESIHNDKSVFVPFHNRKDAYALPMLRTMNVSNQPTGTAEQYFANVSSTLLTNYACKSSYQRRSDDACELSRHAIVFNTPSSVAFFPKPTTERDKNRMANNMLEQVRVEQIVALSVDLTTYLSNYKATNWVSNLFGINKTTPTIDAFIRLLEGSSSRQLSREQLTVLGEGNLGVGLTERLRSAKYDLCWPATLPPAKRTLADLTNLFAKFHEQGPKSLNYSSSSHHP